MKINSEHHVTLKMGTDECAMLKRILQYARADLLAKESLIIRSAMDGNTNKYHTIEVGRLNHTKFIDTLISSLG